MKLNIPNTFLILILEFEKCYMIILILFYSREYSGTIYLSASSFPPPKKKPIIPLSVKV